MDQPGITNYNKLYESDTSGYLKSELGSYLGTPNLPANITTWTSGALSDWDGKTNSEVLKEVTEGGEGYSYVTIGRVLNVFLASSDAKGYNDWYIPSCPQLSLIWMNLNSVNNALSAIGGQQFNTSNTYWSSSERSANYAWRLDFSSTIYSKIMLQNPRERASLRPSGPPPSFRASRSFWLPSGFILKISYLWDKTIIMFRDILHKLKIFFCDDDVEKICKGQSGYPQQRDP